jgi:hypothetical protein
MILSSAGFEQVREALQPGRKIMVKPLHSQMEQISSAAARRRFHRKKLEYGQRLAVESIS